MLLIPLGKLPDVCDSPGKSFTGKSGPTCLCTKVIDTRADKEIVIFKYLPRSVLVAKGLIQSEPVHQVAHDATHLQSTSEQRERVRRRVIDEAEEVMRNQRVSRIGPRSRLVPFPSH
jgi:hypothetical protein